MTERLTVSGATTQRDIDKLLELSNENQFGRNEAYYKLQRYEDLEEQGRLITLPCKIGDTVYEVQEIRKRIQEYTVISVHHSHCSTLFGWTLKDGKGVYSNLNGFEEHAIDKTVFLTKEEAEAALKGAENDVNTRW